MFVDLSPEHYNILNSTIMKMKTIILTAIITLASVFSCLSAQEIIPVDSTHLLSKEQVTVLKYTEKYIISDKSNFELPLEVNYLLGDTIADVNYKIKPMLEKSYFLKTDSVVLIVPLQNDSINILQCQLKVYKNEDNIYQEQIETVLGTFDTDDQFTGSMVYSHINGNFISIYNFNKGECIEIINNNLNPLNLFSGKRSKRLRNNSQYNNLSNKALNRTREAKNKLSPGQFIKDKISPFPILKQ